MLKLIRFLMYGGIILFVLIAKSRALWTCVDVLRNEYYFFEDARYLVVHVVFLVMAFVYFCWLLGATFIQWRMPLWSHVLPVLLLGWVLWTNGWIFRTSAGLGERSHPETFTPPATRAMSAMHSLKEYLSTHSCDSVESDALLDALGDRQWTGYRSFGLAERYRIVQSLGNEPVTKLTAEIKAPGTIFLVCDKTTGDFFLSTVVTAATPQGPLSFVVDGVGKPVTVIGRVRR